MVVSAESPELAISFVLALPASWTGERRGMTNPPTEVFLRLPTGTVFLFFFLEDTAFPKPLRKAVEKSIFERT
jgi:hypothetical protein